MLSVQEDGEKKESQINEIENELMNKILAGVPKDTYAIRGFP